MISAKYFIWLCSSFSVAQSDIFIRGEGQAPSVFFRTPLRAVAGTPAHLFGPTSAGCTAKGKGGVTSPTACSVAVVKAHQPKISPLGLNFTPTTYRPHGSSTSCSRPCVLVLLPAQIRIVYMLCVFGQCGVLGCPYRARPRLSGKELARERKTTRKSEKGP
jgi:hypothetical protein